MASTPTPDTALSDPGHHGRPAHGRHPRKRRAGRAPGGSRLLDGLNPQQREAVEYRGQALLIVAGAGSGKTSVLTRRIASLLETREAWPSQILAITFTNKAAAEMRERVQALVGQAAEGMWISTFHSACVRILRREAENFGFTKNFTIYDSADSRVLIKRIIKELDADASASPRPTSPAKISKLKNELADVEQLRPQREHRTTRTRPCSCRSSARTPGRSPARTPSTSTTSSARPSTCSARSRRSPPLYQHRFRHVLVDEYQDTNHAQYALIRELTRPPQPLERRRTSIADGQRRHRSPSSATPTSRSTRSAAPTSATSSSSSATSPARR